MGEEKTLTLMADAFKELADAINQPDGEDAHLGLGSFSRACSLVSPLFRCLGIAFRFAELDYVAKVRDLEEASKSIKFLPAMVDHDIEANCARIAGSHTRNLLRVKRGIDMVKVLFEHIISLEYRSWAETRSLHTMGHDRVSDRGAKTRSLHTIVGQIHDRCTRSWGKDMIVCSDRVRRSWAHLMCTQLKGNSLKDPALKAYAQVFAPYHGWAIRKAFAAGMYALPNKTQLLNRLYENEA
ncbi:hypothetical protein OROHE_017858 [Orobanche hederae]